MGDRGNIVIRDDDGNDVVFYTHWSGYMIAEFARRALARGTGRWTDDNYLARIVFCAMLDTPDDDARTLEKVRATDSFGIGRRLAGDREYPAVLLDTRRQRVQFVDDIRERDERDNDPDAPVRETMIVRSFSFTAYAAMTPEQVERAFVEAKEGDMHRAAERE